MLGNQFKEENLVTYRILNVKGQKNDLLDWLPDNL
jgi:hypothetical protein